QKRAAIVNVTSALAFVPVAALPVYCATKAALHSFTDSLRIQLKNTNVKIFEVAPQLTETP
ncbi:SDR family NAD(P)-dependent oxidoreductase, partial [Sulfuricurvum sp. MLSB]|uniref:SDR family NAD(P)-dependent oxidoreductase n=2 Tax=unclassified Sulfuricurvum TaxID=2632390 RepID=UPI0025CF1FBC